MKRFKVKSTTFLKKGKLINRQSYIRTLKKTGKVPSLLTRYSRFKDLNKFIHDPTTIKDHINKWMNLAKNPKLPIKNLKQNILLGNNNSLLSDMRTLSNSKSNKSYQDIVINKHRGNSIIGIKNKNTNSIERLMLIQRDQNYRLTIAYLASDPQKLLFNGFDDQALLNSIETIKRNSGNEKLYFNPIDQRVYNYYIKHGARNSRNLEYELEFQSNNFNIRKFINAFTK